MASSLPSFAAGGESAPAHHGTGWTSPSGPTGMPPNTAPTQPGGDSIGDPKPSGWWQRVCQAAGKESAPTQKPRHTGETQAPFSGCPRHQRHLLNSCGKDQRAGSDRRFAWALLGLRSRAPRCRRGWKSRSPRQNRGWPWYHEDALSTGQWPDFGLEHIGLREATVEGNQTIMGQW